MVKGDEIYMEFSLNLERMFPTEESRYDAYKKAHSVSGKTVSARGNVLSISE